MDTEENKIRYLDAEELTLLARQYYSARFPNPQRIGCPLHGEIAKVVKHRQIPDQALREHLFECSECFGDYRQELAQRVGPAPAENGWMDRWPWILKISGASAVLILLLITILIWPKPKPETAKEAAPGSSIQESRAGDGAGPAPNQANAIGTAEAPKPPGDELAMGGPSRSSPVAETIAVDLDNYQNFRHPLNGTPANASEDQSGREDVKLHEAPAVEANGPPSGENIISLPATRASVILRLPETGARGKYNVSFIDAFGKTLWSTSAYSQDGSKLRVSLNLRRISPKKCRLRLARNGEAPAYYDVFIGGK
jgi:hypothetical protein